VIALARARARARPATHVAVAGLTIVGATYVGVLIPQFGRNYLFALGQNTSHPQSSTYMSLLSRLGAPTDTVETDFLWTTNMFSGHRTADNAYVASESVCYGPRVFGELEVHDRAAFVLSGMLSNAPTVASPCLLSLLGGSSRAVRLLRTQRDDTSVFELIGAGTPRPDLHDALVNAPLSAPGLMFAPPIPQAEGDVVGTVWTAEPLDGQAAFVWTFRQTRITQVSVGTAGAVVGPTRGVAVDLLGTDGHWRTVAAAPGQPPYLLASLVPPVAAVALRVTIRADSTVSLLDVHALGL
jgi:hypothetical protein